MSELNEDDVRLERELRAAFAAQRPRRAFAVELQSRLRPRRSLWERTFGAPALGRWTPALAVLLLIVGAGVFMTRLPHGSATTGSSAPAGQAADALRLGAFGVLPAPPASSGAAVGAGFGATAQAPSGPPLVTSAGPSYPSQAPVFRVRRPSDQERNAALAALRTRSGLHVVAAGASSVEPGFVATSSEPASSTDLRVAADSFLAAHGLTPAFPSIVSVVFEQVLYGRLFKLADGTAVPEVTATGEPVGLRVSISGAQVRATSGPLDLPLAQAIYPLVPVDQARTQAAGAGAPRLVYVAANDPASGFLYYEPAYLFVGPAGAVLIAAVPVR